MGKDKSRTDPDAVELLALHSEVAVFLVVLFSLWPAVIPTTVAMKRGGVGLTLVL